MMDLIIVHDDDGTIHADWLIRCKDCDFGTPEKNGNGEDCIECSNSLEHLCHSPDWFCGDGERADNGK